MKEAVIVSAVRTAVGKAPKGTLKNTRSDEMGAVAIKEAVARAGMGEIMGPAAIAIGVLAVIMQSKKKGRARRNPGRRRTRWSA